MLSRKHQSIMGSLLDVSTVYSSIVGTKLFVQLLSRKVVSATYGTILKSRPALYSPALQRSLLEGYVNLNHRNHQFRVHHLELFHFGARSPFVVQLDGFAQLEVAFLCIAQTVQVFRVPFVGQGSVLRQATTSGVNHRCLVVLARSIPVSPQRFELPLEERVKVHDVGILLATKRNTV